MSAAPLLIERDGGVTILTLNRPTAKNALDIELTQALVDALSACQSDPAIRVVLLTGAGGDFCAGGDVKGMAARGPRTPEQRRDGMALYRELAHRLYNLDKPVISAVDGVAYGAGVSIMLLSDFVFVSSRARMALVFHRIGLIPDVGAWFTLPRIAGIQKARELIFSAREFLADEARDIGIANEVLAPDDLMPRALVVAQSLATASPTAMSMSKQALRASLQSEFGAMMDLEAMAQPIAGSSEFAAEAIRRFAAKEPPQFQWPRQKDQAS